MCCAMPYPWKAPADNVLRISRSSVPARIGAVPLVSPMSGLPFSSLGMHLTPGMAEGLEAGFSIGPADAAGGRDGEKRKKGSDSIYRGKWSLTLFSLDGLRGACQIIDSLATHRPAGGSAMLSRRRFVQASSLALTGTACNVAKGSESSA